MRTPTQVRELTCIATCEGITQIEWDNYMEGTTKADGRKIRAHIKTHLPEIAESLALNFYNPYEHKSVKKEGILVYVHSGIEYFFTYQ